MTTKARPIIVFHIGLERTGTTSFQRLCTTSARLLRPHGLLYPKANLGFRVDNHGPLVSTYLNDQGCRDFAIRATPVARQVVLRSLFRQMARERPAIVLISSEHFSSRFRRPEIETLAQDFKDYDCRILVVLRAHRSRFFSLYATSVISGSHATIEDYAADILAPESPHFRYRALLESWEAVFGRERMIVQPYRAGDGLIQTLFDAVGALRQDAKAPPIRLPKLAAYADNQSFGPSFTEAYRLTNVALARRQRAGLSQSYWQWLRQRYCQVRIKKWLIAASAVEGRDAWRLSEPHASHLEALAAADRPWLAEAYGFDLTEPARRPRLDDVPPVEPSGATEILARALKNQVWGRFNLFDMARPALIPLIRMWDRWRMRSL